MKKFLKVTLGVILVIALLFLGVQLIGYIRNAQHRPTEEQLKESERLKQLWEDKKKRDLEESPIVIPEDATDEEKEALQFRQLKKTLEEVLKPVHLSNYIKFDHEILKINTINRFNSNYLLVSADVVWTDGKYYVGRKVLYSIHINMKCSLVDEMTLTDVETYIKENSDLFEEYSILENENDDDNEFLGLLFEKMKIDYNLENVTPVNSCVLSQMAPGHSQFFFYEFIDNKTNRRCYYKVSVDYRGHKFDDCLELLRAGKSIKYDIREKHHSEANWLHLDKLNAQNQSDD